MELCPKCNKEVQRKIITYPDEKNKPDYAWIWYCCVCGYKWGKPKLDLKQTSVILRLDLHMRLDRISKVLKRSKIDLVNTAVASTLDYIEENEDILKKILKWSTEINHSTYKNFSLRIDKSLLKSLHNVKKYAGPTLIILLDYSIEKEIEALEKVLGIESPGG